MKSIFIYGQNYILKNYLNAFNSKNLKVVCSTDISLAENCTSLLLAGGGDICPTLYGETNYFSKDIDYKRDLDELYLIDYFSHQKKTIIGICRGLQVINTFFGGTIIQHIDGHSQLEGKDTTHPIVCRNNGFLYGFFGKTALVNSAHHQAINTCGKGLIPDSISPDGIIESVYHYHLPIYAVQFHPERMTDGKRLVNFISHKIHI